MADSINEFLPEDTEDSDNSRTTPPSPKGSVDKETKMADKTDDEVILSDTIAEAKLAEEERNRKRMSLSP